ncbi:MAG TPA: outer membrane beta-barrel protein [Acidobacteriota bacterium]|nr:outer membrane beta-barrel protein [Acidobacteriota bacterium]
MKTRFLAALAVGLILVSALQSAAAQNFDAGVDFIVALPQNEFRDNIDDEGYGVSGHFGYFIGESPLMVGVDFGYLNYGTSRRFVPLSPDIPEVTLRVETSNNILLVHGFLRLQPQQGAIRPYVQGLFGLKYLFTRSSVLDDFFGDPIFSSTNFDDLAGSWGVGTGLDIRLWENHRRRGVADVSLHLGANYLWGAEAEYLRKGSILRDPDGNVTFLVFRSPTPILVPTAGVRLRF